MATIEVRGYVRRPQAKKTSGGKEYSQYSLSVKQKDKKNGQEEVSWANFSVTDFNNSSPPAERAFATVKGFLKVREVEKNGRHYTNLDIVATEVEIAAPFGDAAEPARQEQGPASTAAPEKDPWDE